VTSAVAVSPGDFSTSLLSSVEHEANVQLAQAWTAEFTRSLDIFQAAQVTACTCGAKCEAKEQSKGSIFEGSVLSTQY
jgi:hypothetical protein